MVDECNDTLVYHFLCLILSLDSALSLRKG